MQIYWNKSKHLHKSTTPTGLVWDTNMAAVSLFWDTDMVAMTSCENAQHDFFEPVNFTADHNKDGGSGSTENW